ncbi:MAG: alpha/beta fold hydrolase [Planctomycetota bacterium]
MSVASSDWRRLYPFESHYLQLKCGSRLHYVDERPSPDPPEGRNALRVSEAKALAPCVLAVHGNPTWSFYYRTMIRELRDSHRSIAVDHLGMGLSDKPQSYPYCLASHTDNLVSLIETLDLRNIVMVVHDWGGAIGLGAATRCVERMAGLVVLNTAAFPPPYVPFRISILKLPWVGRLAMTHGNVFARAATKMTLNRLTTLEPDVRDGLMAPYDSPANRIGIASFVQDIPLSSAHPTYRVLSQLEMQLAQLTHLPIHLVWGMKDWCFRPTCLEKFRSVWPNADCLELDDVGHYVMEESPGDVIRQVRSIIATV